MTYLLANPALQIYHGDGVTCVFDATAAACQLWGGVDDPMDTPDVDDCRPCCRNIARTDRDIAQLRTQRDDFTLSIDDTDRTPRSEPNL